MTTPAMPAAVHAATSMFRVVHLGPGEHYVSEDKDSPAERRRAFLTANSSSFCSLSSFWGSIASTCDSRISTVISDGHHISASRVDSCSFEPAMFNGVEAQRRRGRSFER